MAQSRGSYFMALNEGPILPSRPCPEIYMILALSLSLCNIFIIRQLLHSWLHNSEAFFCRYMTVCIAKHCCGLMALVMECQIGQVYRKWHTGNGITHDKLATYKRPSLLTYIIISLKMLPIR